MARVRYQVQIAPILGVDLGYVRDLHNLDISVLPKEGLFLMGGGIGPQMINRYINTQLWWYMPMYSKDNVGRQSFFFSVVAVW